MNRLLCFFSFFFVLFSIFAQGNSRPDPIIFPGAAIYDFPIPPESNKRLFYIQRSVNSNTIVYDGNLLENGNLDPEEPINVYWMRYDEDSSRKELNYIQRKLAYGVQVEPIESERDAFWVNIVSYKKKKIKVFTNAVGQVEAYLKINGKMARFKSVFIEIARNFFIPDISYIDVIGEDLQTGKPVIERIIP